MIELSVMNVRARFHDVKNFRSNELNKCFTTKIVCGGIKCLSLIDTGCTNSLVSKGVRR